MTHEVYVDGVLYVPENAAHEPVPEPASEPVRTIDLAAMFDAVRDSLFNNSLNQSQVDGIELLVADLLEVEQEPWVNLAAYMLATFYHETARTMQPIAEYGGKNRRYAPWYGRGFVQLTWERNYKKQQAKLKDFPGREPDTPYEVHDNKELALHPDTSALISIYGMLDGDFTGRKLGRYINEHKVDYVNARRVVNGTDKASLIATYARKWESALHAGGADE